MCSNNDELFFVVWLTDKRHLAWRIFFQNLRNFQFGALDAGYLYIHPAHAICSVSENFKLKYKHFNFVVINPKSNKS